MFVKDFLYPLSPSRSSDLRLFVKVTWYLKIPEHMIIFNSLWGIEAKTFFINMNCLFFLSTIRSSRNSLYISDTGIRLYLRSKNWIWKLIDWELKYYFLPSHLDQSMQRQFQVQRLKQHFFYVAFNSKYINSHSHSLWRVDRQLVFFFLNILLMNFPYTIT